MAKRPSSKRPHTPTRQPHRCSECGQRGHNVRTCGRTRPNTMKKFRVPEPWDSPNVAEEEKIDPEPPRVRFEMEPGSRGLEYRCHLCHQQGHDMSTCPTLEEE